MNKHLVSQTICLAMQGGLQRWRSSKDAGKREVFLEDDGRLVFLAFISRIINGTGFAFKEVKGGDEKRFDIVTTYNKKCILME